MQVATAPAIQGSRTMWHVRGTWSPREDRLPSAVWLGILWLGMIAGFGVDLPGFVHRTPPPPGVMWVHGAVFTVWMLLLTAQVLLVLRDRVAWHRKLGWFAAGWACLMAVMGPWGAIATVMYNAKLHGPFAYPFIATHVADIGGFLVLTAWGIALRKNSAAHKRMMILATIALADPGFSRFSGYYVKEPTSVIPWFIYMFYGNVLLIALMVGWDWWRGRLVRSFVLGSAGLVVALFVASVMNFWEPWRALTLTWVTAWAKQYA
jgi:hypothetical protein